MEEGAVEILTQDLKAVIPPPCELYSEIINLQNALSTILCFTIALNIDAIISLRGQYKIVSSRQEVASYSINIWIVLSLLTESWFSLDFLHFCRSGGQRHWVPILECILSRMFVVNRPGRLSPSACNKWSTHMVLPKRSKIYVVVIFMEIQCQEV